MARWLWLSVVLVAVDQASKVWVLSALRPYEPVPVVDGFFNLVLVFNTGAAFSFLSDAGGWQRWALSALAVVAVAVLTFWLARLGRGERWTAAALAMVIGGAVGNLIDRVRFGHVVDFLDFFVGEWHWPAFNAADSAITLGVVMPNANGWQLLRQLKENPKTRGIPVVLCSIVEGREHGLEEGAAAYLRKPVTREDLLSTLQSVERRIA